MASGNQKSGSSSVEPSSDAEVTRTPSSRRTFMLLAGAATGVACAGGLARLVEPLPAAARAPQPTGPTGVTELFAQINAGTRLHTSTVVSVHDVHLGGVAVLMRRPDATTFQLDVLRRAERDGAIGRSANYSVFAVNGGTGSAATAEPDGLAAMALADALARAERTAPRVALLTHAERARRHPSGAFRVRG